MGRGAPLFHGSSLCSSAGSNVLTGRARKQATGTSMARFPLVAALLLLLLHPASALSDHISGLLAFRDGLTSDPQDVVRGSWNSASVDSAGCPIRWQGVACNNGIVTTLSLPDLGLVGVIKPGTLGKLSGLNLLSLANNSLEGPLPQDLGALSRLQVLDLSNNAFNGSIPSSLGGLRNLRNLSLSGNLLEGTIPDIFSNLSQLVDLELSSNSLSGNIPSSLGTLQQLVSLNLCCNNLNGTVPIALRSLGSNLEALDLHRNGLSGRVDSSLMSLHGLRDVDMSCNQFTGPLPWQQDAPFAFPAGIVSVNLSFNLFSGELAPINAEALFASDLQILDVSSNKLSGKLPSFPYVFSLRVLRLQNNSFTGVVPPIFLAQGSVLEELDISRNKLSGGLDIIKSTSLTTLDLSYNTLSGPLPIRLGSCSTVNFSNNLFSGDLSPMRVWQDGLEVLDLSGNSLRGTLPNETTQLLRLMYLNLSHNNLSGSIPSVYSTFRKLTTLDLSFNGFSGDIPGALFHTATLTTLQLSNNLFTGGIPVSNALSSSAIPGGLFLSPTPTIVFSPLQVLDLSSNRLEGSIPAEIASLKWLTVLNLSKNNITGKVPSQLSLLLYLEDLDISFNQLTGEIPAHLPSSLQKLNLSENQLSGVIPNDLVQRNFPPSSYFPGNPRLKYPDKSGSRPFTNQPRRHHHRRLSSAIKAGLIGGCVAVAAVIVALAFFVYSRTRSRHQSPKRSVNGGDEKAKSPQKTDFAARAHPPAGYSGSVSFSREQLLPTQASPSSSALDEENSRSYAEGLDLARKSGASPSRKRTKSQVLLLDDPELPSSSLEHSTSGRVQSPDKLAGDICLLDTSFLFTAEQLSSAPAEVLGRSSHGTSYKATMDQGHVLAVKWLREGLAKNKKAFTSEAKKLGSIKHPNVMPLRGYYWGPKEHEKLIITDYMSYGSLADRLYERAGRRFPPLTWSQRVYIAVGIAQGLSYLHVNHRLPHGNLKASNVLLDGPGLVAKLSDYSLHKLMTPVGTSNQILNAGALGYRAPELANVKQPSPTLKGDVYAFGVILMEIVTGKGAGDIISGNSGAVDLTDWVKLLVSQDRAAECYDQVLVGYDRDQEPPRGINSMLALALRCISLRAERPGIKTVLEELSAMAIV